MRRFALLAALLAAVLALAVSAVTLAGGRSSEGSRPVARSLAGHHATHRGMHARMLADLAERLGVTTDQLRTAIRGVKRRTLDRAVERGAITPQQRDALAACLARRAGGTEACDRRLARRAFRALRRDAKPSTFAQRKRELAGDLAAELGRPEDEVVAAVRAELAEKLDRAVAFGVLSERGRTLALGCFDEPASCDLRALRSEVRMPGWHGRREHRFERRHRHGHH